MTPAPDILSPPLFSLAAEEPKKVNRVAGRMPNSLDDAAHPRFVYILPLIATAPEGLTINTGGQRSPLCAPLLAGLDQTGPGTVSIFLLRQNFCHFLLTRSTQIITFLNSAGTMATGGGDAKASSTAAAVIVLGRRANLEPYRSNKSGPNTAEGGTTSSDLDLHPGSGSIFPVLRGQMLIGRTRSCWSDSSSGTAGSVTRPCEFGFGQRAKNMI